REVIDEMFEAQESTPWYRSLAGLVFASILLPPIGLVLLWTRRGEAMGTKFLGTLCIVALGGGYFYLYSYWRAGSHEAQYAALEATCRFGVCLVRHCR